MMKTKCGMLGFVFFLLGTSCKSKAEVNSNISTTLQDGSWRITYFVDSTQNETGHFTDYGFAFGSDQMITAIKDSITVTGEWHTGDDNDLTNLIIDFADIVNFKDLNADWDAYELTDSEVKLRYFDDAGNDFLTFRKN
jgi:hypothetical protein